MPKFLYKHSLPVREKRLQETSVLLLSIAVKAKQVTLCKHDTASLAPVGEQGWKDAGLISPQTFTLSVH